MKKVSWAQALTLLFSMGLLVIIFFGFFGFPLHIPIILQIFIAAYIAKTNGYRWEHFRQIIFESFARSGFISIILLLIGALVGIWMASGTIPTIIYYGLNLINPKFFYIISFLLCCIVSFAMGTGIGTLSTVGLALFSIGVSLSLPLPIVAGSIVSGSYFGDRFSPLSSIAIFTAHTVEIEIREMLIKMLGTTIPAFIITAIAYLLLGTGLDNHEVTGELLYLELISKNFNVSPLAVLPPVIIIIAAFLNVPTIINLASGLIISFIAGIILLPQRVPQLLESLFRGININSSHISFNELFSRGGMVDLLDLIILIILAAILAGILENLGTFQLLLEKLMKKYHGLPELITITASSSIIIAMVSCNQLLAVLLPGKTFLMPFERAGEKALLGRALADTGLVFSPLIPWNINGILVVGVLGVGVLELFPYAFMNWLLPLLTVIIPFFDNKFNLLSKKSFKPLSAGSK